MERYFFHIFNDETVVDHEGQEHSNDAAALQVAIDSARALAAESVSEGHLVLKHRIEVRDERGETVGVIHFGDVVKVDSSA